MNRSSVTRHRRAHLLPSLVESVTADPELSALDPLLELRALFARMKRHLASAEETGNLLAIRMIGAEVRAALELFGKFQALAAAGTAPIGLDPKIRRFLEDPNARAFLEKAVQIYEMSPEELRQLIEGPRRG